MNVSKYDIRNVMDMISFYGGFGIGISTKLSWALNIIPPSSRNTLPVIDVRGLIGSFHDWRNQFSTYPCTYDLFHAFQFFSYYKGDNIGFQIEDIILEVDHILRQMGFFIIRYDLTVISKVAHIAPNFIWDAKVYNLEAEESNC